MSNKSIWERIDNMWRGWLYLLIIFLIAVPLLHPLGLPLPISEETRNYYNFVENNLKAGDVAIVSTDYSSGSVATHQPAAVAFFKHAIKKNIKLIFVTYGVEGDQMADLVIKEVDPESYGYVYGEDYVNLGYVAGGEVGIASIAMDLRSAYQTDFYGTPIDDIPMLQNINNYNDYDVIAQFTSAMMIPWINHFVVRYGVPMLGQCLELMWPENIPYVKQGDMVALMFGARGAGEYEFLLNEPGRGIQTADTFSLTQVAILIFLAMGNIGWYMRSRQKKWEV